MSGVDERTARISKVLREAARLHHDVYRITDGADDDWASWYADWLARLSELPELLPMKPVPSELTYLLVKLDREYSSQPREEPWADFYARELVAHFAAAKGGGP
jgi:hypothetical protein